MTAPLGTIYCNTSIAVVYSGSLLSCVVVISLPTQVHSLQVSGILYKRLSFLSILTVPPCIGTVCDRTVGRLVASAPPPDQATPMGATLQLQRTQQMERLEQQVLMAQLGAARRQPNMVIPSV